MIKRKTLAFIPGGAVPMQLGYDPERPLEVTMVFHELSRFDDPDSVKWTVSRNVFYDGLSEPAGGGDVNVSPDKDGTLRVSLDSPDGYMEFVVSRIDVESFVNAVYDEVSEAEEEAIVGEAFDTWIAGILEGEA